MDERRLELKVGAFALLAVALLAGLVLSLGNFASRDRFRLYADFAYAGGLPSGALVKIAGVKVGRVREVEFRPDSRVDGRAFPVRLHVDIDASAARALRSDAVATVSQQGALGESHLEILPGTSARSLEAGAVIHGIDPPRLDLVLSGFYSLIESATEDEAFRSFLVEVSHLARMARLTLDEHEDEVGGFVEGFGQMFVEGGHVLADVRIITREAAIILSDPALKQLVKDLSEVAALARSELPKISEDTRTLLARLDHLTQDLGPEDTEKIKDVVVKLDRVSALADELLTGVKQGEGTVGQLVKDPQLYEDMRDLFEDLKAHPWKLIWKK